MSFRLIITVKRGSAAEIPVTWIAYPTLEAARRAAESLERDERVGRVIIVRDAVPPVFVEWAA